VLQVFVPLAKDFAVELTMTDIKNNKRRVVLSTSVRDISMTPLHAKLSLSLIKRDVWLNLSIDLVSLISDVFPSQTYKSLESFSMSGSFQLSLYFLCIYKMCMAVLYIKFSVNVTLFCLFNL